MCPFRIVALSLLVASARAGLDQAQVCYLWRSDFVVRATQFFKKGHGGRIKGRRPNWQIKPFTFRKYIRDPIPRRMGLFIEVIKRTEARPVII